MFLRFDSPGLKEVQKGLLIVLGDVLDAPKALGLLLDLARLKQAGEAYCPLIQICIVLRV